MSGIEKSGIVGGRIQWRLSSRCQGGGCVEVGITPDAVSVRDSKTVNSPVLTFTKEEWKDFLDGVYAGEFDVT